MNAVKIIEQDDASVRLGGYGVVWGGVDLDGETFTQNTDFMLDLVPTKLALYDHAKNGAVKHALGTIKNDDIKADDDGLWIEAELDRSKEYVKEVVRLAEMGVLGWSSGSVGHLTERDKSVIKTWPIVEFSLTPTPAEPRTLGVDVIKTLSVLEPELKALLPESDQEIASAGAGVEPGGDVSDEEDTQELKTMSDEEKAAPEVAVITRDEYMREMGEVREQLKGLDNMNQAINALVERLENSPVAKRAGTVAPDSEADKPEVKSFGDFLIAIKRGNQKRLAEVYRSTKDLLEGAGGTGGYLVPEDMRTDLLMLDPDGANLSNLVQRIPVSGDSGTWPALDQYVTPTAGVGDTAYAAGLTPAVAAEAAALGEDNITFEQLKWDIVKVGGVVDVSNELADDAPAVDTLLRQVFQIAIDGKLEHYILNGTGAGQPTGILPSACSIGVTTATNNIFAEADAMAMLARFKVVNRSRNAIAWVMHRGVIPDLAAFTASDRDMVEWRGGLSSTLLGYPILYSEHMPQDDNDDVLLADFSGYLLFDRQQLTVDFSEHAKFENDLGVWRYKIRVDGMPWLKSAITLADPQGSYTVSPFVYHDD